MSAKIKLKINFKSLSEEARINRIERRRLKAQGHTTLLNSLRDHQVHVIRLEARHTHLARMFTIGVPYSRVEAKVKDGNFPNTTRIHRKLKQYYPDITKNEIDVWIDGKALAKAA